MMDIDGSLYDYSEEEQDFYEETHKNIFGRKGYPIDHRCIKVS